uniref:Uncharacterized protein n=1 Tax=Anguilla anguilla TaxID=7936 RepID=A0A0E9RB08_ANGAN
MSSQGFAQ